MYLPVQKQEVIGLYQRDQHKTAQEFQLIVGSIYGVACQAAAPLWLFHLLPFTGSGRFFTLHMYLSIFEYCSGLPFRRQFTYPLTFKKRLGTMAKLSAI